MSLPDDPATRLATYGTLAPGRVNHHQLADLDGVWETGTVRGWMHLAGWGAAHGFAGLRLDPDAPEVGVHLLTAAGLRDAWPRLDAFEGAEYRRVAVTVETNAGPCAAYLYELSEQPES